MLFFNTQVPNVFANKPLHRCWASIGNHRAPIFLFLTASKNIHSNQSKVEQIFYKPSHQQENQSIIVFFCASVLRNLVILKAELILTCALLEVLELKKARNMRANSNTLKSKFIYAYQQELEELRPT